MLFNFIEFFEKLNRMQGPNFLACLTYIKLNFIPSFFENFPVTAWLATLLLIKEFTQHNEWETMTLLQIKPRVLVTLIAGISLMLAGGAYLGREQLFSSLMQKAEAHKLKALKHNNGKILLDEWFNLSPKMFCHIQEFNYQTNQGKELTIIRFDKNNTPQVLFARLFSFIPNQQKILFKPFHFLKNQTKKIAVLKAPFLALKTLQKNNKYQANEQELWYNKIQKWFDLFHIFLYPIITLAIFLVSIKTRYAWVLAILSYPFFLVAIGFFKWIFTEYNLKIALLFPYLIFFILLFFLWYKNQQSKNLFELKKKTKIS
jgi:hypothetical protein